MPIHFHYDKEKQALYGTFEGTLTVDEILETLKQITTSDEYPPEVPALWDLRKLDFSAIESEFRNNLISMRSQFPERGSAKIACVANSDLAYGMTRMYQTYSSGMPQAMMVFRDFDEAEAWLLDN